TPISYITVLYYDRFVPDSVDLKAEQWNGLIHAELWELMGPLSYVQRDLPNDWNRVQNTRGLYLWARGPATGDTLFNCRSQYEASNGVKSEGCFGGVIEGVKRR
ncbi:MAG TPA: hypothetical protein PLG59_14685, partial [bacterium]|nr:hypothetical protein [bacterium]